VIPDTLLASKILLTKICHIFDSLEVPYFSVLSL
jgi:hypothetical protein